MTLRSIVAATMPKSLLYSGTNVMTFLPIDPNSLPEAVIQAVVNFDESPRGGYAWFVAKPHVAGGTPYQGGPVAFPPLQWSVTNASWADTNWMYITNSEFRDYFDLDDGAVTAPQTNYSWRSAAAVAPQPECLATGQGPVEQVRWGDYSHTTLDPSDSLGFWTVQEYSGPDFFTEAWGTWIGQIVVPFQ